MDNGVRYPFKEVEKILYKQAHKVKKFFPNRYEVDELVNEVWLKGSIQKLDRIGYVAGRAYWDMIDYIRSIEGRDFMRNGLLISRPKHITNFHHVKRKFYKDAEHDYFDDIESREGNQFDIIDNKEHLDRLLECLPDKKRDILEKYYLEGMTLVEIGDLYGLIDCSVSKHKKTAIGLIREFHDIEVESESRLVMVNVPMKQLVPPLEEILPEYVSDYEIDNECAMQKSSDDLEAIRFISEIE